MNLGLLNTPPIDPPNGFDRVCPGHYVTAGAPNLGTLNLATTADRVYWAPLLIGVPVSFDRVSIDVSVAGTGSTLRFGLYSAHPDAGYPEKILAEYGTASSATTGAKSVVLQQVLDPGLYWAALGVTTTTSAPTVRGLTQNSYYVYPSVDLTSLMCAGYVSTATAFVQDPAATTSFTTAEGVPKLQFRVAGPSMVP